MTEWATVGDYRRGLSSYDVKLAATPLLMRALPEPGAYEVLYDSAGLADDIAAGDRAANADVANIGDAPEQETSHS